MFSHDVQSSTTTQHDSTGDSAQNGTRHANTPLFELANIHGRITLDSVYRNGLHALRRLEIRNLSDQYILVKMRSNLRNQIAFQLKNENVADLSEDDLHKISTNTVAWSQAELSDDYHFNQLFNYVNHIDQLDLEPYQARTFILAFLPDRNYIGAETRDEETEGNAGDANFDMHDTESNLYNNVNITGSLFFFGYAGRREESKVKLDSQQDGLVTSTLADYQLSVKFRASVCQSVLWTDVTETGLNFDDCMLGEVYHKDFTIQNKSEIDLYWLLNTVDLSNLNREDWLQFTDPETNEVLDNRPIPGYSHRRIRLTFMPKEVGEFNYDLQVENANDARNVVQTKIHATVRSITHKESLIVSSGNVIDFGDCISGQWTKQQVVLNNVSESPVEVRFMPEGADVIFDIKSNLDASEETDAGGADTPETKTKWIGRKYTRDGTRSAMTTPTATVASLTELSAPSSEVSSRSTSPTSSTHAARTSEYDGSYSVSLESSTGIRIHTPSLRSIVNDASMVDDSDSDMGLDSRRAASTAFSEGSLTNGQSTPLLSTAESYTRIEDLVLKPGKERVIQVSYRPQKDVSVNDFNAGQLIRRNFRITLVYRTYRSAEPKERKAIQCRARTCTSFVEVIPKQINFGDTDVGTLKSLPINIFNRSDIMARVELQFTSKVLNCLRGEIVIQPRSYVELKLDLYPRKVNPEYRKQITLVNYLNKDNDQIIEVQSTNIDKNRVTFHSLFYRILTATGANFLDFGAIALNSPSIRTFTVENIRSMPLTLEITTSMPDEIVVYTKRRRTDGSPTDSAAQSPISPTHTTDIKVTPNADGEQTKNTSIPSWYSLEAKKEVFLLRRLRSSQRSRADRAHHATAYLDLATNLVRPSSRRKRVVHMTADGLLPTQESNSARMKNYKVARSGKEENTAKLSTNRALNPTYSKLKERETTSIKRTDSFESINTKSKRPMGITAARYKSRKNLDWPDIAGKSRVPFEDLLSVMEHSSKAAPPLFPKQAAEEKFVRYQLAWRRELERLVEKGDLVRTSFVDVAPQGEEEVVVVFTPNGETKPYIHTAPKKQDARILLRLINFDRNIEQTEFENLLDLDQLLIPVREVILRAQLCCSVMDLGQRNINFGMVERNERHTKSIVLHNRSETPLLYAIRKSGSIASGDIDLSAGRLGVVRAFGKREIEFAFEPTLPGPFLERLVIENIRDRSNDQVLLLKAMVRKPSTFFIKSLELSFGPCVIDQVSPRVETIVLTNTNKQSRLFEVRVDPNEVIFGKYYGEFDFIVEDDECNTLSKEAEEEIENLEQKLKIAKRKGQPDKVKKYLKKLAKLKKIEVDDEEAVEGKAENVKQESAANVNEEKAASKAEVPDQDLWTSSLKESPVIFKKTSESVVFPLDPQATKTISVYFKAVMRPLQPDSSIVQEYDSPTFPVKGRILAHEYKNTDVCKNVFYSAVICRDQATYLEALASETEGSNAGTPATGEESVTTSSEIKSMGVIESHTGDVEARPEPLKLERSHFDGGKVEVDQKSTFYVRVSNDSDEPVDYDFRMDATENDFFIEAEKPAPLEPRETRKIMFEILPTKVGKQQHTFMLRNRRSGNLQPFTLQCLVHCKRYLEFPSLSEETQGELDLGYSYVDPGSKYSQVTPLLVENVSDQDLYITCQSNLSHQVLIFMDEAGERGLVEMMPFKRGSMTTVWVAVQPNLLTGYLGSSADECRELVGGIKFSVYTPDDVETEESDESNMLLMLTQTVKFTSIIGQSHLELSDRVINLGCTDLLHNEFYGAFTIKNKSGQLPLDYEVECPSGNIVLDRRGGTLSGWRGLKANSANLEYMDQKQRRSSYGNDTAMSLAQITFRVYTYRYGLLNEKLIVTNKHNSQEVFEIEVRLFVDCKKLDAWSMATRRLLRSVCPEEHTDHHDHREAHPLPVVKWESIYICPVSQSASDEKEPDVPVLQVMSLPEKEEQRFYMRELEVANASGEPMQLVALSDVDITAGWVADEDKVKTVYASGQRVFLQRSGQLTLHPGQRIQVRLYCPSADKLDNEGRSLALQGKSGLLKGMLVLYDMRQKLEVLAIELQALFCVSLAELAVDRIDLGKIGHTTSWKPVKFNFSIRNQADVPLTYDIQAPEFFEFSPTDKTGVALPDKRLYIPSRKTQTIEGILDPRKMQDHSSGQHRFDVRIANQRNGSNTMFLRLKAQMTVFELVFERLTNGELVLPVLHHPISVQNVPCDNWFAVHNTTYDDIRFEIGADMSPDLEGLVKLEVLSRYSNSPLKGGIAISPKGKMEVRVRASANESSRLPRDRPDLTDPAGAILAKLWVTTRPIEEDTAEDRNIREVIPVRSVLVESPTFSLSERRLDFKQVTYYQEGQEQESPMESVCMPESCPLTVVNHAPKVPLRFKVTVTGPAEFPAHEIVKISPLAEDGTCVVEPGGSVTLTVAIVNPKDSIPDQFKIHVDDLDALGETRQTASIYFTEIVWDL
ncbi:hypothetical protein DFQ28_010304 [Apophysomyces sp. BC1034]|nr:hypothetical protein DFQ30_009964 [Apophysomyces sp. BC1015]KAG0171435.1 hypothetical protein DFQ29_008837 [Apophysomyces sp. BC1021]KAG0184867.1 hypothetical protein DFQ28_010304 [Apophysomyces sp. BC1034]